MRSSDWSSDVCSSDLAPPGRRPRLAAATACLVRGARLRHAGGRRAAGDHAVAAGRRAAAPRLPRLAARAAAADRTGNAAFPHDRRGLRAADRPPATWRTVQIGRASCRERVCLYVYIAWVAL